MKFIAKSMVIYLLYLFIVKIIFSDYSKEDTKIKDGFHGIEVSDSESCIYFLSNYKGISRFCRYNIALDSTYLIASAEEGIIWYSLSQSPNDSLFSVLEYKEGNTFGQEVVVYEKSNFKEINRIRIPDVVSLKSIFLNDSTIVLTAAMQYGNNSPIARKSYRAIDFYTVDIYNSVMQRISFYENYSIGSLNVFKNDSILITKFDEGDMLGFVDISDSARFYEFKDIFPMLEDDSKYLKLPGEKTIHRPINVFYSYFFDYIIIQSDIYFWYLFPESLQANVLFKIESESLKKADYFKMSEGSPLFFYTTYSNPFKIYGYDLSNRKPYYDITIRYSDIGILDN